MRRLHPLYVALLAPALLAVAAVVRLAFIALKTANEAGNHVLLPMAWVVAFVVGLPLLLVVLPLVAALQSRTKKHPIVPNMGRKIP